MKLKEMFRRVLLNSGQFIIPNNEIELDIDKFRDLVEEVLPLYGSYCPKEDQFNIETSGTKTFEFTPEHSNYGVPSWISQCVPVRLMGAPRWYFEDPHKQQLEKKIYPWTYRKPLLYLPVQATYDIHACYDHIVEGDITEDLVCDSITTKDKRFFRLLQAQFMMGLGRSRRAFTLNEIPITLDASELVSEGEALWERELEGLVENEAKWYLAWT